MMRRHANKGTTWKRYLTGAFFTVLSASAASADQQVEFFEKEIRPILATKCAACHGEQVQMAGLRLDNAAGFFKGADTGPIVAEGDPESSRLLQAVRYQSNVKMPPTGKLPDEEIEALANWVKMGAPWPEAHVAAEPVQQEKEEAGYKNPIPWSFDAIQDYDPPAVENEAWVKTPIDRFVLNKLEEARVEPAPRAGKLTLLRRAKFDLHGLPPTQAEIDEFVSDSNDGAFERLVERLLASPRYGEKWGRHWLDVARYADSTGLDEDLRLAHSWRYRDYVIEAFNHDTPYDRFVTEQLAGDLLPPEKPGEPNVRGIVATGFLALGPKPVAQQDKVKLKYDVIDEQIDTTSKTFMGLTISCSRCHDHKFDPILTKDYYSMASIFASTQNFSDIEPLVSKIYFAPLVPEDEYKAYKEHEEAVGTKQKRIESIVGLEALQYVDKYLEPRLADYMLAARQAYHDGGAPERIAEERDLDCEVLKIWVEYLTPGKELRPYLQRWYEAAPEDLPTVAQEYQQRADRTTADRIEKLKKWKQELAAAIEVGEKIPEKPKFDAFKDRFYSEVYMRGNGAFALKDYEKDKLLHADSQQAVLQLRAELKNLKDNAPPEPPMASAVKDGEPVQQTVFVRGSHHNPGEVVPKSFPVVLAGADQEPITEGSGRLALAKWLTGADHPLTSRVMVNRIWLWHFGEGLVRTPDNWGVRGEEPTHPKLLDYLAKRFMNGGWSIKQMHRLIMASNTYQMASRTSSEAWKADPTNRLWSRFNRRRLSVEEMRDSMLTLDGSLNLEMGGTLQVELDSYMFKEPYFHPDKTERRTVYLPLYRNKLPGLLSLFDFVDSTTTNGKRAATNIPPQGLYVMNSDFVQQRAHAFAEHLLQDQNIDDAERVEAAYSRALTRKPTPMETKQALEYVADYPAGSEDQSDSRLLAWQGFCHILIASNEYHYVD